MDDDSMEEYIMDGFFIALTVIVLVIIGVAFVAGMAYCYWGLSIGMAPVLWILMIIGMIVGLVSAIKNAIKALRETHGKGVK